MRPWPCEVRAHRVACCRTCCILEGVQLVSCNDTSVGGALVAILNVLFHSIDKSNANQESIAIEGIFEV